MMRETAALLLSVLLFCHGSLATPQQWSAGREGDAVDPAINPVYAPYTWPDQPPDDLGFPRSEQIRGIRFTGRYANYTGADTFYPAWAPDGHQYSIWTDGYIWTRRQVEPVDCRYCNRAWKYLDLDPQWGPGELKLYHCHSNVPPTCTGQARIDGDSPLNLEIVPLGKMYSGDSLYPCVSLIADGIFYVGSYSAFDDGGRFNGFRYSRDWNHWTEALTEDWKDERWTDSRTAETDFFGMDTDPRRFNVLHAVVFGRDNALSPDGKIYLTGHGQIKGGKSNWDKGDAIYLCRVDSRPEAVTRPDAYEFFGGRDEEGRPLWIGDVREAKPILEWKNRLGSESITFIPALGKYLMTVARLKENEDNLPYDLLTFWEADEITGPYRLVHYLRDWGPQAYFPNIPAKFISSDGRTMWLCASCNYSCKEQKPFGCRYAASFHEIVLDLEDDPWPGPPALSDNIAATATVDAGFTAKGHRAGAVVDGSVRNISDPAMEWAAQKGKGAWIRLTWATPQSIDTVRLYDRPDLENWVHSGLLEFSDGSREPVRAWFSNRALAPTEISFPPKTVTWVRFTILEAEGSSPGLSEMEVYSESLAGKR